MIAKNCEGKVPQPGALADDDKKLLGSADAILETARAAMDRQAIHRAVEAIWQVVADANRYFANAEPWALKKTDPERMNTVLYVTAETVREIAILAQPVMPASAAKILDLLSVPEDARDFSQLGDAGRLEPGVALPKPEPVFPRYVEQEEAAS